jgi:outer membrane protein, multidrug efflux system
MRLRPSRLAMTLCAAATGCATAPPVRTPSVVLPVSFESAEAATAVGNVDSWWRSYEDAQLTDLIERALRQGFDVHTALARLEEAGATRREALSRFNIQGDIKMDGEIRRTDNLNVSGIAGGPLGNFFAPTVTRTANATLPISWELDLFGRRNATRRAAEADMDAARFDYEGARAALAAGVGRGLFEARGLSAQLDDARATAGIERQLMDIVRRRAGRGLSARSDVDRVAADLAQSEARAADLAAALEASKRALLVLLGAGTDPRATMMITSALPALPLTPARLPGELLVRRPDVRRAEAQMRGAAGRVRLAELAFYPTITLQGAIGIATQSGGIVTTSASQSGGGGIALPIFDRVRLHAQMHGASARAEQAVLAYEQSVQKAYGEVDQAAVRFAEDRRRIALLEDGAGRADRALIAAHQRYQRGLADLQEVLDADRTARAARLALTSARTEGLQRSIQLYQALGGGWQGVDTAEAHS